MEEHLSLGEAARHLDISERTARRWIKSGKLRAYKPGRDYWIPESAIREVVEESVVRPKTEAPPLQDTLFNGVSEQERRALEALEDYCDRLELVVNKPDLDPTFATVQIYIVKLVGDVAPALWETETIRPALRPVFARYAKLARRLVEMVEQRGGSDFPTGEVEETSNVIAAAERFARAS